MNEREARRRRDLDELVDAVALEEFRAAHGRPSLPPVAVVIAAYRERDNIGTVVGSLPGRVCGLEAKAIVVVDGEEDGTAEIVRRAGHYAVVAPVNRGQGAALRLGYRVAREHGARFIVTADADGQTDPADLEVVLDPVVRDEADFVNGSRRLGETHSTDTVRNLGVRVYALVVSVLTRRRVTDTANPIRAMRAELTGELELAEPQYQASELLISVLMRGERYAERPVTMRARGSGRSKKGGNLLYGLRYGRVVLRTYRRERRRRRAGLPLGTATSRELAARAGSLGERA
ncbi:MAG TPA: glycosyltransferase family 2 protein [Acidimicrobiales bacterium]|nr:glycosyltransferase family 2 protein [Acidimicrobiales bacterium]